MMVSRTFAAFLYFILYFFLSFNVAAQVERNTIIFGGTFGYSREASDRITKDITNEINIDSEFSYMIGERTSIGLILPIEYTKTRTNVDFVEFYNGDYSFSVGPNLRYYYPISKWVIFIQGNFTYGIFRRFEYFNWVSSTEWEQKAKLFTYSAGLGSIYFIKPKVGFEGVFLYRSAKTIYGEGIHINNLELSSFRLNFGIKLYLTRSQD